MKNIVVTGGSGKAGRAVCRHLVERGYTVLNVDMAASPDPARDFARLGRMHVLLLAASLIAVAGAVGGTHGLF